MIPRDQCFLHSRYVGVTCEGEAISSDEASRTVDSETAWSDPWARSKCVKQRPPCMLCIDCGGRNSCPSNTQLEIFDLASTADRGISSVEHLERYCFCVSPWKTQHFLYRERSPDAYKRMWQYSLDNAQRCRVGKSSKWIERTCFLRDHDQQFNTHSFLVSMLSYGSRVLFYRVMNRLFRMSSSSKNTAQRMLNFTNRLGQNRFIWHSHQPWLRTFDWYIQTDAIHRDRLLTLSLPFRSGLSRMNRRATIDNSGMQSSICIHGVTRLMRTLQRAV